MVFGREGALWNLLNFAVSLVVYVLLFALIFKLLPDAQMRWRDVWMGATLTAALFAIGKSLIGLYLGYSRRGLQLRGGWITCGADRLGVLLSDHRARGGRSDRRVRSTVRLGDQAGRVRHAKTG